MALGVWGARAAGRGIEMVSPNPRLVSPNPRLGRCRIMIFWRPELVEGCSEGASASTTENPEAQRPFFLPRSSLPN